MSFLKSSLFYLSDINSFFKEKHVEFGDFTKYLDALRNDEKQLSPFLERVIMNKHRYDLGKAKFIQNATSEKKFYKNIRIFLIIVDVLIITACTIVMFAKLVKNDEKSVKDKLMVFLIFAIIILIVNFICVLVIRVCKHTEDDMEGRERESLAVESYFEDFDRPEGVALYYAIKRNFFEPSSSKKRKLIKKYYDTFTPTLKDANKLSFTSFPTITDAIKKQEWKNLLDSVKNGITTKFESPIKQGSVITGYKSLGNDIDQKIKFSNTLTLTKEIGIQGDALNSFVANKPETFIQLSDEEIKSIIETEIVPVFNMKTLMQEIPGMKLKNDSGFALLTAPSQVSNNVECMLNCEINDACTVAAFNVPSKKCSLYKTKLADGTVIVSEPDEALYVKGESKVNVFFEGGDMIAPPKHALYQSESETTDCHKECLAGNACVKYVQETNKCKSYTSDAHISLDNINSTCKDGKCISYKQDIDKLGAKANSGIIIDKARDLILDKLLNILQKHKYELDLVENSETIKKALTSTYGNDLYNTTGEKINDLLDTTQIKANEAKKHFVGTTTPKYISQDSFIAKMNNITYQEFASMYYSIDTLSIVVNSLNTMVKSNLAMNLSGENNMFVIQEREKERRTFAIVNVSLIMFLSFGVYIVSKFNNQPLNIRGTFNKVVTATKQAAKKALQTSVGPKQIPATAAIGLNSDTVDMFFKIAVPIVFICFVVVMMSSYNSKINALNSYNREVLEKNGEQLTAAVSDLSEDIADLNKSITNGKKFAFDTKLKEMNISVDKQKQFYNHFIVAIDLLEKCNLLMDGADIVLQFPWIDISYNLIIVIIALIVLGYVFVKLEPLGKLGQIKELYKLYNKVQADISVNLDVLKNNEDDEIGATLKIVAFIIFVIMVIMFSAKLIKSSRDYKMGLYNSKYYAESQCVT